MSEERRQSDSLDEQWFVVDEKSWDALHERLEQPAQAKPRLSAMLREAGEQRAEIPAHRKRAMPTLKRPGSEAMPRD